MTTESLLYLLLTGTFGGAAVKAIESLVIWFLNRRAAKEDQREETEEEAEKKEEEEKEQIKEDLKILKEAQQISLMDRISYLGQVYIRANEVDFEDRRRLHKMHNSYHKLGGNGDLDSLMRQVDELPLKKH